MRDQVAVYYSNIPKCYTLQAARCPTAIFFAGAFSIFLDTLVLFTLSFFSYI